MIKYVNENIVSRAKMGLFCIFVDDQQSPTTHFLTSGSISYLRVEILVSIIINFILLFSSHISQIIVKLSLNHVLLCDNLKGNAKRNSFEFRRINPVNKKQKILYEICCNMDILMGP